MVNNILRFKVWSGLTKTTICRYLVGGEAHYCCCKHFEISALWSYGTLVLPIKSEILSTIFVDDITKSVSTTTERTRRGFVGCAIYLGRFSPRRTVPSIRYFAAMGQCHLFSDRCIYDNWDRYRLSTSTTVPFTRRRRTRKTPVFIGGFPA